MDTFFFLFLTDDHFTLIFLLTKYFLIVSHLLNRRYLVDLGKDKCFVVLFTLLFFNSIPLHINTNMNLQTIVYHLFSYPDSYNQLQLIIYLPDVRLWTELNEPFHIPSRCNHNQQLDQLVSCVLKHHSKLKLVVCVNLHLKQNILYCL